MSLQTMKRLRTLSAISLCGVIGAVVLLIYIYPMYIQYSWGSMEMEAVLFVETGDEYKCWYYLDTPAWAKTARYNVGYKHLEDGTVHKYVITEWGNLNCMKTHDWSWLRKG